MSNLQKLYAKKQENAGFNAEVNRAVEAAVAHIKDSLAEGVKAIISTAEQRGSQGVSEGLKTILPAINQIVADSVRAIVASIEPQDTLKAMVRGIHIPDHSEHLQRIEQAIPKQVDLAPVMSMLTEIKDHLGEEEEERKWVFTVNRDPITKLMDTVTVEASEDEE